MKFNLVEKLNTHKIDKSYKDVISKFDNLIHPDITRTESLLICKDGNFLGGMPGTHREVLTYLFTNPEDIDYNDSTLSELGFVRCSSDEYCSYIELPRDITRAQLRSIDDFLRYIFTEEVIIYANEGRDAVEVPSDNISIIKGVINRYYTTGELN